MMYIVMVVLLLWQLAFVCTNNNEGLEITIMVNMMNPILVFLYRMLTTNSFLLMLAITCLLCINWKL